MLIKTRGAYKLIISRRQTGRRLLQRIDPFCILSRIYFVQYTLHVCKKSLFFIYSWSIFIKMATNVFTVCLRYINMCLCLKNFIILEVDFKRKINVFCACLNLDTSYVANLHPKFLTVSSACLQADFMLVRILQITIIYYLQ